MLLPRLASRPTRPAAAAAAVPSLARPLPAARTIATTAAAPSSTSRARRYATQAKAGKEEHSAGQRPHLPYGPSRRAREAEKPIVPGAPSERTVHPSNPPGSPALPVLYVHKRGGEVLEDPVSNYGAAHSLIERELLGLSPFLPHSVHTLSTQVDRAYNQLKLRQRIAKYGNEDDGDIMQYTFLRSLKDQNSILFYALLRRNLKETLRIIYTPVVGAAITHYSRIFRRPDGTYISYPAYKAAIDAAGGDRNAGRKYIEDAITHYGHLGPDDVDLLTCTDSEGILGIGDQGVGGINIAIGKNTIYAVGGGFDPQRTLSIGLDVGTNNASMLADPLYLGWRNPRVRGAEYDAFMDDYTDVSSKVFPHALLHFEDFGTQNAHRLLLKYRPKYNVFWDDEQGTAAVTLAAVLSAVKVTKTTLKDQRYIIFGAGTAGLGIAAQIRDAISIRQGVSKEEAAKCLWLIDRDGLLVKGETELRDAQVPFARSKEDVAKWPAPKDGHSFPLLDVVKQVKPTVLIGVSGQGGAFTEAVVKEMSAHCDRPTILPLSNPSRLSEARPDEINEWSEGRALIATGSPFPPVPIPNSTKMYTVAESNNALGFPGLGGGVILAKAKHLTDGMIVAGVDAIASLSPALNDPDASLLPDLTDMRNVSMKVSAAVALAAKKEGVARAKDLPDTLEELEQLARHRAWEPLYRELRPANPEQW